MIPRAACSCKVCKEARRKGLPYSRSGAALFVKDINALVDTPEEVFSQLNRENILKVRHIFYTHWHPDHTLGMRVVEQISTDWLRKYLKLKPDKPKVKVYALKEVMNDLQAIKNKFGSYFLHYETIGAIETKTITENKELTLGNINVIPVPVLEGPGRSSTVFVFKEGNKKVIYAPCDLRPFPETNLLLKNSDVLILGGAIPDGALKKGYVVPENNVLRKEQFSFSEIIKLIKKLKAKRTILTHLEEEWGKSYTDYLKLEKKYARYNISFAFDGMRIKL